MSHAGQPNQRSRSRQPDCLFAHSSYSIMATNHFMRKKVPPANRITSLPALAILIVISAITAGAAVAAAAETQQQVTMMFIKHTAEVLPKLSNLEVPAEDDGVLGGRQAIEDSNTTGRFLGHHYVIENAHLGVEDNVQKAFLEAFGRGIRHFILDVTADELLAAADSEQGKQAWFYNIGVEDDLLRTRECRLNVLHLVPSHSMRADALAQYLVSKKWRNWFLVTGRRTSDVNFAAAVRRAAKKFGGKIVAEKPWEYGPDMRRTAASTVPLFTQGVDYDVLIVSDVIGEFGEYLMYRTWTPSLVAGTQGLKAVTWGKSHEQWGAAQLQSRFLKNFGRKLSEKDLRRVGGGTRDRRGCHPHEFNRQQQDRALHPQRSL